MTIKDFYEWALAHDVEDAELYVVDSNGNYATVTTSRLENLADGGIVIDSLAKLVKQKGRAL